MPTANYAVYVRWLDSSPVTPTAPTTVPGRADYATYLRWLDSAGAAATRAPARLTTRAVRRLIGPRPGVGRPRSAPDAARTVTVAGTPGVPAGPDPTRTTTVQR